MKLKLLELPGRQPGFVLPFSFSSWRIKSSIRTEKGRWSRVRVGKKQAGAGGGEMLLLGHNLLLKVLQKKSLPWGLVWRGCLEGWFGYLVIQTPFLIRPGIPTLLENRWEMEQGAGWSSCTEISWPWLGPGCAVGQPQTWKEPENELHM